MRHWNFRFRRGSGKYKPVFTLPMRHWNWRYIPSLKLQWARFYPTYEALKPSPRLVNSFLCPQFLPYLWGIETVSRSLHKRLHNCVFTLPMRHWNPSVKPLLPLRETRFYPTYEALKQLFMSSFFPHRSGFYPTYEALKPQWKERQTYDSLPFLPYLWGIETI